MVMGLAKSKIAQLLVKRLKLYIRVVKPRLAGTSVQLVGTK